MARHINPLAFGSYTITAEAGSLFSFAEDGSPTTLPTTALSFKGRLETANVRARMDGVPPTSTVGELIDAGDDILLDKAMVQNVQFIRDGGTDAELKGHFYSVEASVFVGG